MLHGAGRSYRQTSETLRVRSGPHHHRKASITAKWVIILLPAEASSPVYVRKEHTHYLRISR